VAVLVNDMAPLNIDARLVAAPPPGAASAAAPEALVALQNGCICCTIREDLVREVRALAAAGAFDYLIVEGTGISLPLPVAATFALNGAGESGGGGGGGHGPEGAPAVGVSDVARLDTLVGFGGAVEAWGWGKGGRVLFLPGSACVRCEGGWPGFPACWGPEGLHLLSPPLPACRPRPGR
jgi:hypothetical protein